MKTFVVQRHQGRHGLSGRPDAEDWSTPHVGFANTNMLSLLPASQDNSGKTDVLHTLYVGDDLNGEVEKVEALELWLLLHDCNLGDYLSVPRYEQPLRPKRNGSTEPSSTIGTFPNGKKRPINRFV